MIALSVIDKVEFKLDMKPPGAEHRMAFVSTLLDPDPKKSHLHDISVHAHQIYVKQEDEKDDSLPGSFRWVPSDKWFARIEIRSKNQELRRDIKNALKSSGLYYSSTDSDSSVMEMYDVYDWPAEGTV